MRLKIKLEGTDFQKKVWRELLKISWGETVSYREIAIRIGRPKAVRAVANAIGQNKIPIIIPCHRVIRTDGQLGGYSGGVRLKRRLLEFEKKFSHG